eukprot:4300994-Prymnesium_polylepis.1
MASMRGMPGMEGQGLSMMSGDDLDLGDDTGDGLKDEEACRSTKYYRNYGITGELYSSWSTFTHMCVCVCVNGLRGRGT